MNKYKTTGEQMFLVASIFFFLINLFFQNALHSYLDFSFWWILIFLMYPIVHLLQFRINTRATNYIYTGVILLTIYQLLFIFVSLFAYIVDIIFKILIPMSYLLIFNLVILIIGFIYSEIIVVRKLSINSPKIKQKTRIVQISDLHAHGISSESLISKVAKKVKKQKPDILVITGDLFDYYGLPSKNSLKEINALKIPTYYVYGNHENMLLRDYASKLIDDSSVIPLVNENIKFNELQLIGLDDCNNGCLNDGLKKQQIDNEAYSILLQHKPINVENISKKGIDLMLSGHTHGGQFFPFNLLLNMTWKYLGGYYRVNDMNLYVSRGTGTKSFPFRLFIPNELTVVDLLPQTK
ncbi:metallophosphoesterase [Candidatus Woesearchaeota archaeon]|nr:metallophosphoesterase [Candidatus Woesearchaeota archaeon]